MQLDIVSDFVCPWCYVGKRRLDKALVQRPNLDISVRWLPFQQSVRRGVSGVLFFVFANQYGLSGAQPVEEIVATLDQLQMKTSD